MGARFSGRCQVGLSRDACPEPKAQADPLTREHSPMAEPEKRSSNLLFSSI